MIRAKRRPGRAPRPPPRVRTPTSAKKEGAAEPPGGIVPTPPPPPPSAEGPSPFDSTQLIHLGNALSRLNAKHPSRFLDVYQEQLALALPLLTKEECELVCPTMAMSPLVNDPLRRAFLERCAQVDAGRPVPSPDDAGAGACPDIATYQKDADNRRRRMKHFRNIYVIEASVRKEHFSFFTSLPPDVRAYLDGIHTEATKLPHEGSSPLAQQVAAVLDQLGVDCDLARTAGPLGLHVVAKNTNPRVDAAEIVYECSDTLAYYAVPQDDKGASPALTAPARLRHRLLERLGVKMVHIPVWEWRQMSEAHRVNYMVKLQSLSE